MKSITLATIFLAVLCTSKAFANSAPDFKSEISALNQPSFRLVMGYATLSGRITRAHDGLGIGTYIDICCDIQWESGGTSSSAFVRSSPYGYYTFSRFYVGNIVWSVQKHGFQPQSGSINFFEDYELNVAMVLE